MAFRSLGQKFEHFIGKEQELLDAAREGKVDGIEKLIARNKSRQSTFLKPVSNLLTKTININCTDREGDTPLHLAALHGHRNAVEVILKADALTNITDHRGCTPLHLAAWNGHADICALLLGDVNSQVQINLQNGTGDTALHSAAQYGHALAVEVLLKHSADPTIRNLKEESPLDLAAQYGRVEIVQILLSKYPQLVEKTILNHSPLHLAAACGHRQVVEMLLNAGYQINTKTDQGTALHVAALYCKHDVVDLLLEKGIDAGDVNKEGHTAFEMVQQFAPEIAQTIRDYLEKQKSGKSEESEVPSPEPHTSGPSPKPVPRPRKSTKTSTGSLKEPDEESVEDLYAKPLKEKSEHDHKSKADTETPDHVFQESPPIPPRTQSVLRSHEEVDMATTQEVRDSVISRSKKQQDEDPPRPHLKSRPLSQPDVEKSRTPILPPRPLTTRFDPVPLGKDDLNVVPPKPCTVNTNSQLVELPSAASSYIPMDGIVGGMPKSALQKEKPPKPIRKKKSPVPIRKEVSPPESIKPNIDEVQIQTSSDLIREVQQESQYPAEDYEKMSNVKPKTAPVVATEDEETPDDTYDVLFPSFNKGVNVDSEKGRLHDSKVVSDNISSTTYLSKSDKPGTSVDENSGGKCPEIHRIQSGKFEVQVKADVDDTYLNSVDLSEQGQYGEVYYNVKDIQDIRKRQTADQNHLKDGDISKRQSTDQNRLNDIPKGQTVDQKSIPKPKMDQNILKDEGIPNPQTDQIYQNIPKNSSILNTVKGDNSSTNCDTNICDNVDSFVSDNDNVVSDNVNKELLKDDKRLSNGVCDTHVDDEKPGVEQEVLKQETSHKDHAEADYSKAPKPDSLEFHKKRIMKGEEKFPLTPTGYVQPPTPDFPPPSPNTAQHGIEEKFAVVETNKRTSRDMETITEADLLEAVGKTSPDSQGTDKELQSRDEMKTSSEDDRVDKSDEEPVVMRRSSRRSTSSSSGMEECLSEDELGPFAGLLKGSAQGGTRKVVSQICENVAFRHSRAAKRKSLPITGLTFDPVMEREEEINPAKIMDAVETLIPTPEIRSSKTLEEQQLDYGEEWDKIENIMASFGSGIARESVFVKEFEPFFTKQLAGGSTKIQSVGDWLDDIELGQYENTLVANGFDHTDFLSNNVLEEQDLEVIGVKTAEHRKKILDATKILPDIQPIDPDNPPNTVEQWLNSLHLSQYLDTFISHKCDSMDRVLQLWELELNNVLHISALGHRKRILVSLSQRKPLDRQYPSLKKRSKETSELEESKKSFKDINLFKDYTKVKPLTSSDEDVKESSQQAFPPVDSSEDEDVFRKENQGKMIRDSTIHLRPPHHAQTDTPVKQWRHRPEMLIKGCCNYTAHYLGSTLVKELSGTNSTIEGIAKLKFNVVQKSADVIAKIPTIMLSMSYRGVKFIDAKSKKVICDHEIGNIFCACQDAESMNFFAYITRDNQTGKHYCHVFNVRSADMAREIILTLGEAFEVAYQMALKEKASVEAMELERKLSHSDQEDTISISSKASVNTV